MNYSVLNKELTVIILAGGQSARMGTDKGLLSVQGVSFIQKLVKKANSFCGQTLISVGKHNQEAYANLNVDLVVDENAKMGPIGGIVSALKRVKTPWFMLISVDSPWVSEVAMSALWQAKKGFDGVLLASPYNVHPLVGVYHRKTFLIWETALKEGNLRVMSVIAKLNVNTVSQDVVNINTREDFKAMNTEGWNES
ncbi:MAG: molybdopterin-guanine dinucleotide biosynthesis protein A [Salibacteraceae bacterium]|jgi:molybdopterin-guanine dinucleotide biosynthesis protein A